MKNIFKKILAGISGFTFLFTLLVPVFANATKPNLIRAIVAQEIKYILGTAYNYGVVAQNIDILTDFESNVLYYEGNLGNINRAKADYVNTSLQAASDEVIPLLLNGISNRVNEYYSTNNIDVYDNYYGQHNKINIDTTKIESNVITLVWDYSKIGSIAGENVTIYKNNDQLLIFKMIGITSNWCNAITGTNGIKVNDVNATSYIHGYDGTHYASITASLIFDFGEYGGTINLQEVGGIIIAPKATVTQSATCGGWVVASSYSNGGGEWHYPLLRDEAEEETTTTPEETTTIIETTTIEVTTTVPETTTKENTTTIPEITTTIPETTIEETTVPEITTTIPETTTTVPETTIEIITTTQVETTTVEITTTILETTTEEITTTVSETTTTVPEVTTETETVTTIAETTVPETTTAEETTTIVFETETETTTETVTTTAAETTTEMVSTTEFETETTAETTVQESETETTITETETEEILTTEEYSTPDHKKGEVEADIDAGEKTPRYIVMMLSLIAFIGLSTNILLSGKKKRTE